MLVLYSQDSPHKTLCKSRSPACPFCSRLLNICYRSKADTPPFFIVYAKSGQPLFLLCVESRDVYLIRSLFYGARIVRKRGQAVPFFIAVTKVGISFLPRPFVVRVLSVLSIEFCYFVVCHQCHNVIVS